MAEDNISGGSFSDLGLEQRTLETLDRIGFTSPTPIQQKAIMPIMMGRDILACAQTGSGKTASFVLPLTDFLSNSRSRARMARVLVLEPTRELAMQVSQNVEMISQGRGIGHVLLVGGVNISEQVQQLKQEVDILIATPGRLIDLVERSLVVLSGMQTVVIDEADRMLDMGFVPDVRKIMRFLPSPLQTLLFSATIPEEIRALASEFLNQPKEIYVDPPSLASTSIRHTFSVTTDDAGRRRALHQVVERFIRKDDARKTDGTNDAQSWDQQCVVFCNRKSDIDSVKRHLSSVTPAVAELHGDMDQIHRTAAIAALRDGSIRVLVCSDVAARGLDIPGVALVVNYDIPVSVDDYVHRVGRTGRAGRSGDACTLVALDRLDTFSRLRSAIGADNDVCLEVSSGQQFLDENGITTLEQLFEHSANLAREGAADHQDGGSGLGRRRGAAGVRRTRKGGAKQAVTAKAEAKPKTKADARSSSRSQRRHRASEAHASEAHAADADTVSPSLQSPGDYEQEGLGFLFRSATKQAAKE